VQPDGQPVPEAGLRSPLYRGIHLQHEWTTSVDEILAYDTDSLLGNIAQAADEMGGQLVRAMAEHISAICDQTGNVIDASGSNFYDAIIESQFDPNALTKSGSGGPCHQVRRTSVRRAWNLSEVTNSSRIRETICST
jgi:hypothetical protein